MKITVINGQNHKGSSYHIGKMIADKIAGDNEITEFFLPRDLNRFCQGCYACIKGDENCPFYAEKRAITEALEKADVLIFTTPTYCMRASAPMKSLIDLTFSYWMPHRPRKCMFGKRAVVVSTAAGAGAGKAVKDIKNSLFYWGVPYIKTLGIALQAMNWQTVSEKKKQKLERITSRIARGLSNEKPPRVGFKTRFIFRIMGNMQKSGFGSDEYEKQYWEEQGWLSGDRPWKK